jgi:hypothetical protein
MKVLRVGRRRAWGRGKIISDFELRISDLKARS